jgi:hypothetical protein
LTLTSFQQGTKGKGMTTKDPAQIERERCVAICRRRAVLWRNTSGAQSSIPAAREEAKARANEASYLADLLESGGDLPVPSEEMNVH